MTVEILTRCRPSGIYKQRDQNWFHAVYYLIKCTPSPFCPTAMHINTATMLLPSLITHQCPKEKRKKGEELVKGVRKHFMRQMHSTLGF